MYWYQLIRGYYYLCDAFTQFKLCMCITINLQGFFYLLVLTYVGKYRYLQTKVETYGNRPGTTRFLSAKRTSGAHDDHMHAALYFQNNLDKRYAGRQLTVYYRVDCGQTIRRATAYSIYQSKLLPNDTQGDSLYYITWCIWTNNTQGVAILIIVCYN